MARLGPVAIRDDSGGVINDGDHVVDCNDDVVYGSDDDHGMLRDWCVPC